MGNVFRSRQPRRSGWLPWCIFVLAAWIAGFSLEDARAATPDTLVVPIGRKAKVDGWIRPGEWADADTLEMEAGPDWMVRVLLKHDGEALYAAFLNLAHGRDERYPEVFLDMVANGGEAWDENDWWFHVSYADCMGHGFYREYHHNCYPDGEGWYASNYPLRSDCAIEMRVSFGLVGFAMSGSGTSPPFGLALAVADYDQIYALGKTRGEIRYFWPPSASKSPGSWITARLAPTPPGSASR